MFVCCCDSPDFLVHRCTRKLCVAVLCLLLSFMYRLCAFVLEFLNYHFLQLCMVTVALIKPRVSILDFNLDFSSKAERQKPDGKPGRTYDKWPMDPNSLYSEYIN